MLQNGSWLAGIGVQALTPILWAFIVILGLFCVAMMQRLRNAPRRIQVWAFAGAVTLVVVYSIIIPWLDADEAEHLHVSWLMSQGLLPFRDFWEHHSPVLWCLLSPVLRVVPTGAYLCDAARVVTTLIAASCLLILIPWSRRLSDGQGSPKWAIWLWACALVPGELYNLRPDVPADLLCLGGLSLLLGALTPWRYFLSATLLASAGAFTPKHLIFVPVLLVSLLLDARERKPLPGSLLACVAGGVVGVLPLCAWLSTHGLVGDFVHWVFKFNAAERGLRLGGIVPLAYLLLVGIWVWSVRGEAWQRRDRVITAAALLAALWSFCGQPDSTRFIYNLQMFLLLTVAVAPAAMAAVRRLAPANTSWVAIVAVAVLPLLCIIPGLQEGTYLVGRQEVVRLQELSGQEPVLGMGSHHPLFSRDAVDLNLTWHWTWLSKTALRKRVQGMTDTLIRTRPPVIASASHERGGLCGYLLGSDAITASDALRLQNLLDRDYRFAKPGGWTCWVRKDRPLRASEVIKPSDKDLGVN